MIELKELELQRLEKEIEEKENEGKPAILELEILKSEKKKLENAISKGYEAKKNIRYLLPTIDETKEIVEANEARLKPLKETARLLRNEIEIEKKRRLDPQLSLELK